MSVNRSRPHLLVLPEDDANRQIANGFLEDVGEQYRRIQILPAAGGWVKTVEQVTEIHASEMRKYPNRHLVLLIDFDNQPERLESVKSTIPGPISDRVFVLGTLSEPEKLKPDLGSYERIGHALARDCREETATTWSHRLLRHNEAELARMRDTVRPILFVADA
jgi:hypothetical protein